MKKPTRHCSPLTTTPTRTCAACMCCLQVNFKKTQADKLRIAMSGDVAPEKRQVISDK